MLEEKKLREISQKVNEIGKESMDYVGIYYSTQMLLDAVFGETSIFEENNEDRLIVNISKIIQETGIKVFEQPISYNEQDFIMGMMMKRRVRTTGENQIICLVEDYMRYGHTRTTIAVLIYYYFKYYEDKRITKDVRSSLNIYKTMEEMTAITFARMLLMPPLIIGKEYS